MMSGFVIYSLGAVKVIKGGKDISDRLSWAGVEFLMSDGIG